MSPALVLSEIKGFPELRSTDKIPTVPFIKASREVITIVEKFGFLSNAAKDMRNNVNQLESHYFKDKSRRQFIEDMILSDNSRKTHTWLLWLNRALELIERFFWLVLNDRDVKNEEKENLKWHIGEAYNEVLRPYHSGVAKFAIKVMFPRISIYSNVNA